MSTPNPALKYIQPDVVSKLSNMELRARLVVEGFITGLHKSPYHGFSVEFAEHRQYMAGDEIRHIDWKVYGKTDRYYIKQYEEETNLKSYLIVDASASMGFSSRHLLSQSSAVVTKFEYASYLAAALAYLMIQQRDAVGLTLFDSSIRSSLIPHATKASLRRLLIELEHARPENKTAAGSALHRVAEQIRRRGLVIILSDLFDDPDKVITALKHFRYDQHEVVVMHILDPAELSFAFGNDALFKDVETSEEMMTRPFHMQQAYRRQMNEFIERYKRECRQYQIDYVLLDSSTPFDTALFNYLSKRSRLG